MIALLGGVNTGVGGWLRASGAARGLYLALCLTAPTSSAAPDSPRTEYFTGFEVSDNYASAYVGGGYALGKAGLYEEGWRVRAVGAYGRYHYDGALLVDGAYLPTTFEGQSGFAAALVGYQLRPGRLILKLFAGIEAEDQHIVPHDPNNTVQGSGWASDCKPRVGSICPNECFCRPTRPTAPRFRNIGRWRGSAIGCASDSR